MVIITHLPSLDQEAIIEQHGCQYCNTPVDATIMTGVYECPNCLTNFSNTKTVAEVVKERDFWEEEARRYAQNADYHREKSEK